MKRKHLREEDISQGLKDLGAKDVLSRMSDDEIVTLIRAHKQGFGTVSSAALIVNEVFERTNTTNNEIIEFRELITQRILDTIC